MLIWYQTRCTIFVLKDKANTLR